MAIIGLTAPWIEHYRKILAMFFSDHEVKVIYDDSAKIVKLYVDNDRKAEALEKMMLEEVTFGDVVLKVEVVRRNPRFESQDLYEDMYQYAFEGNSAFKNVIDSRWPSGFTYVIFAKYVVQYFNDDLGDANGVRSTLYEDLARDIFKPVSGVYYCTEV